jgi:hypothetical protein
MTDLEVTANVPSPPGKREHIIPRGRTICPHARTPARNRRSCCCTASRTTSTCPTARAAALPDDQALQPYRATWPGVWVPRSAAAGRRLGGRHRGDPGQGGPGAPPSPTLPAWAAQSRDDPAADHAATWSADRVKTRITGVASSARRPHRPRRRRPHPARASTHRQGRRRQGDTRVNRGGDRTTPRSTLDRHRGLMLGGCAGGQTTVTGVGGRPGGPARPAAKSATRAVSCRRCAAATRRLTGRSHDAASTDPTARGGNATASAAAGRQAAAAPAAQPDRPAQPVRPAPALLTPPRS